MVSRTADSAAVSRGMFLSPLLPFPLVSLFMPLSPSEFHCPDLDLNLDPAAS